MTLSTITPSLWVEPGRAREVADLYVSLFADATVDSDLHLANPDGNDVDLVVVRIGGSTLQIMGAEATPDVKDTDKVSLTVVVADQAALDKVWDGLIAKGGREMACSWVVDPYGVRWQVLPQAFFDLTDDVDPDQRQRVMEALWQMVKVDVAGLEAAAQG